VANVTGRWLSIWVAAALCSCGDAPDERLLVFAASSLTGVFDRVETEFEAAHPRIDVVVSYGGSSSLAGQIEQGAPADVFASADWATITRVLEEADRDPIVFARNRLVIAVEDGNPESISGVADLADDDLIVVLADGEVPAGAYAAIVLELAGVALEPASLESNVRAVAAKVALGEADAGLVYRTDITANDDHLDDVPIPEAENVIAEYPIVVVRESGSARAFVDFVAGNAGRRLLADAGFELP